VITAYRGVRKRVVASSQAPEDAGHTADADVSARVGERAVVHLMRTHTDSPRSGPDAFLTDHLVFAAACTAAATSAGGVFIARAVRAHTARGRAAWVALATLEFAIAIRIIRTVVGSRPSEATPRETQCHSSW